jgi:hypothetical protein
MTGIGGAVVGIVEVDGIVVGSGMRCEQYACEGDTLYCLETPRPIRHDSGIHSVSFLYAVLRPGFQEERF